MDTPYPPTNPAAPAPGDPTDPTVQRPSTLPDPQKLALSAKRANDRMRWVRERRAGNMKLALGPYYGPEAAGIYEASGDRKSPVNLIGQAIRNYHALLCPSTVANTPTAKRRMLSGEALKLGALLDQVWERQDLCRALVAPCIKDAMFGGIGIALVGEKAGSDQLEANGAMVRLGEMYAERVDLNDWIIDPVARTFAERAYEGHRYRVPLEYALDCGVFKGKEELLRQLPKVGEARQSDYTGVDLFSKTNTDDKEALFEQVELMDITIFAGDKAYQVTMGASLDRVEGAEYLLVSDYSGPPPSRYAYLWFDDVPNNTIPQAMASGWIDLHFAGDRVVSKMIRQMLKAKRNFAFNRGSSDDAQALLEAPDMEGVGVDDAASLKQIDMGGVMDDFYKAMPFLEAKFADTSAGAQQLAGTAQASDSKTLGEAEIRQTNQSNQTRKLHERVDLFQTDISKKLSFYATTDPMIKAPVTVRIAGGEQLDLHYAAENRRGDWQDFSFTIRTSRSQNMDPAVKAAAVVSLLKDAAPAVMALAQQGACDFMGVMRNLCQLTDNPELAEYLNDPMVQMTMQQMGMNIDQQTGEQGQPVPMGGGPTPSPKSGVQAGTNARRVPRPRPA